MVQVQPHRELSGRLRRLRFGIVLAVLLFALALWTYGGQHDELTETIHEKKAVGSISDYSSLLTGVLVEIRCHKSLLLVLESFAKHFPTVPLVVWHSPQNQEYLRQLVLQHRHLRLLWDAGRISLQEFDPTELGSGALRHEHNDGVRDTGDYWYSRLLKNTTFWKSITTPWALHFQTDSLFCRSFSNYFDLHDVFFLGGPSKPFADSNIDDVFPINPSQTELMSYANMNGGLSIRHVQWTIDCLTDSRQRDEFFDTKAENVIINQCRWNRLFQNNISDTTTKLFAGGINFPAVTEFMSYEFASDGGKTHCFLNPNVTDKVKNVPVRQENRRICPVGVHKPWQRFETSTEVVKRFSEPDWYRELLQHCPGLDHLRLLQGIYQHRRPSADHDKKDKSLQHTCIVRGIDTRIPVPCQDCYEIG